MITTLALPLHQQLRHLRQDRDLEQQQLAPAAGVSDSALRRWELGQVSPYIRHAAAVARALHHEIVITRHGVVIAALAETLADLAGFRHRQHVTRADLAALLYISPASVGITERKAAAGQQLTVATLERYFDALGYELGLASLKEVPTC
ncbi:helix-turn-helix domain-containing protein [Nonomuraea roseoviolacea]|uniref:Transcriptional regulator with XRE-family HTH domain n=1 Tax=Nonomuraea roseoviolacea subsp. carminata TaxID=160689 RepID=A0ABT1KAP8_9ACTN|nr:helix-turn-helix transcriptional regulator [Nonomuraea roseoviolacea]MCP2350662.1 transcriptional regulator with XRE-family HTH domain [Nonomuraea roseoviolacea subsp. carminata]